jgi:hypothetical protein
MTAVQFPAMAGILPLSNNIQTSSGAHPTFYATEYPWFSLEVKWPGHEADHSPPSTTKVKNSWSYTATPPASSWHGAYLSNVYIFMV